MAYVITRLCRDCVDGSCVDVCPVDCIVRHEPSARASELPNQLFINPEECISCGLCEPECPWEAIFDEGSIPSGFEDDVPLNALTVARPDEFHVPVDRLARRAPSRDEVEDNRRRWLPDLPGPAPSRI